MSRNRDELCLASRYIHTGNSGVTLTVARDVKNVDRAVLSIRNGAFGAFSTLMEVRGHESRGMSSLQLRDLALMFMDAAESLDQQDLPLQGQDIPALPLEDGRLYNGEDPRLPPSVERLLPYSTLARTWRESFSHLRSAAKILPEVLKSNSDLSDFYEAYFDRMKEAEANKDLVCGDTVSGKKKGKQTFALAGVEYRPTKAKQLRFARQEIVTLGVLYVRYWWTAHLATLSLDRVKSALNSAVKEYKELGSQS